MWHLLGQQILSKTTGSNPSGLKYIYIQISEVGSQMCISKYLCVVVAMYIATVQICTDLGKFTLEHEHNKPDTLECIQRDSI